MNQWSIKKKKKARRSESIENNNEVLKKFQSRRKRKNPLESKFNEPQEDQNIIRIKQVHAKFKKIKVFKSNSSSSPNHKIQVPNKSCLKKFSKTIIQAT